MKLQVRSAMTDTVTLSRAFLDDPRLSYRAKGLLAVALSRRDGGAVDLSGCSADENAVAAALRELEKAGYYSRSDGTLHEVSRLPLLSDDALPVVSCPSGGTSREEARPEAESVARVIDRLNELRASKWAWVRYTPLSARHKKNTEHISGRLKEGYAEDDLVLVLEYLATADGGKEASRKYFDCVTPFNTRNFERHLTMAREWDARGRPAVGGNLSLQRADGHDPAIYERRVRGSSS